jgi:hypothetical protein
VKSLLFRVSQRIHLVLLDRVIPKLGEGFELLRRRELRIGLGVYEIVDVDIDVLECLLMLIFC